ncbi:hypothetical protein N0V90_012610 [Kalmusia sp. IMI 367209]|nr:hypothetical protein N0V90_012610 [Kalmusia sp. IMI 367209]
MFKPQVLRRSFSLFRRIPSSSIFKSAARDGHDTIRVQRVRISKRFFTKSRLAGTVVVGIGAYTLLDWLDEEAVDEEESQQVRRVRRPRIPEEGANDKNRPMEGDEEDDEQDDEDEEEEDDYDDEDDEGLIFFPTGFSRPKPRTYYRGSDPEWQEFIRLAPDRQRMDKIRGELVALVRDLATKNPQYGMRLGKIDTKKGSIWIEVKFPDGPPIEYERPGYELTEDLTLRKTTRPVDQIHHKRLANALVPTTVANSVYYDIKRRVFLSWRDFKRYIGWGNSSRPQTVQGIISALPAPPTKSTSPNPTPAAPSASTAPSTPADVEKQSTPSAPGNPALERFGLSLPDPKGVPTMDLLFFRLMMRKHQKQMQIQPPRGTFIVSGLVEVIGDRAKMTLDVTGVYDPRIAKYIMLQAKIRSMTEYKQRPKGGP